MTEVKDLHETRDAEHVEGLEVDGANINDAPSAANWKDVLEAAIRGEAADKTLSWHEALGPYARSILWSFGVSLCVVMSVPFMTSSRVSRVSVDPSDNSSLVTVEFALTIEQARI